MSNSLQHLHMLVFSLVLGSELLNSPHTCMTCIQAQKWNVLLSSLFTARRWKNRTRGRLRYRGKQGNTLSYRIRSLQILMHLEGSSWHFQYSGGPDLTHCKCFAIGFHSSGIGPSRKYWLVGRKSWLVVWRDYPLSIRKQSSHSPRWFSYKR